MFEDDAFEYVRRDLLETTGGEPALTARAFAAVSRTDNLLMLCL